MNVSKNINLTAILAALLCAIMWGSNFVTVKLALVQLTPLFLTSIRLMFVSCFLIWFIKVPSRAALINLLWISITFYTINFGLVNLGIMHTDAGLASIIIQLEVPLATILGAIFLKEHISLRQAIGLIIAFVGVILVAYTPTISGHLTSILLLLGGAVAYGVSILQVKQAREVGALTLVVYCSLFGGLQLLLLSFLLEHNQWHSLLQMNFTTEFSLITYIFMGTSAFLIWTRLIHIHYLNQIMPFSLLVPVFAMVFGRIFLNEMITSQIILGAVITILGITLVTVSKQS